MVSRPNSNHLAWQMLWASAIVATVLGTSATVMAAVSGDQVKRDIEARYPVQVLKVGEATADGRTVFIVTVMRRGGNYNNAFQVNTLVVDAETGELVPQFRHHDSGYELSGAAKREPGRDGTEAPR